MTNPKGIAGKTFSVVYSMQGSGSSWSPNGNAQHINTVFLLCVLTITQKLNSKEETLEALDSKPAMKEPYL